MENIIEKIDYKKTTKVNYAHQSKPIYVINLAYFVFRLDLCMVCNSLFRAKFNIFAQEKKTNVIIHYYRLHQLRSQGYGYLLIQYELLVKTSDIASGRVFIFCV